MPHADSTKCPKLDKVINCWLLKEAKTAYAEAAKLQTLLLDGVGSLSFILEEPKKGSLQKKQQLGLSRQHLCFWAIPQPINTKKRRRPSLK